MSLTWAVEPSSEIARLSHTYNVHGINLNMARLSRAIGLYCLVNEKIEKKIPFPLTSSVFPVIVLEWHVITPPLFSIFTYDSNAFLRLWISSISDSISFCGGGFGPLNIGAKQSFIPNISVRLQGWAGLFVEVLVLASFVLSPIRSLVSCGAPTTVWLFVGIARV